MDPKIKKILLSLETMMGDDDNNSHLPSLYTPQQIERFAKAVILHTESAILTQLKELTAVIEYQRQALLVAKHELIMQGCDTEDSSDTERINFEFVNSALDDHKSSDCLEALKIDVRNSTLLECSMMCKERGLIERSKATGVPESTELVMVCTSDLLKTCMRLVPLKIY